jgi:hypothetical protein
MSEPTTPTLFNIEDFVRPDAKTVIESRTVDVRRHTRTIVPRAIRKPISGAAQASRAPETVDETSTVKEARAWLEERITHGIACPVCTRYAKVYTRTITAAMARALITMHLHAADDYVHLDKFLMKHGQHSGAAMPALLRHWELVEKKRGKRKDGASAVGYYRVTERGHMFAENKIAINKWVRLYDDRALFLENDEKILIVDALREKFNYEELMKGA